MSRTAAVGIALVLASASLAQSGRPLFPAATYPTHEGTSSVVIADVDRDGHPDLVTANAYTDDVIVLLGSGRGHFDPQPSLAVGDGPSGVVALDLNGDARVDLATANADGNSVSVLLAAAAGGFSAPATFAVGARPRAIVAGNFDGDHYLDLATANALGDSVTVLLNDGLGGFTLGGTFLVGDEPRALATGDLDRDGALDLVTANYESFSVSVLLGNGAGGFAPASTLGQAMHGVALAIADVSGDGALDIVSAGNLPQLSVFVGNGAGGFAPPVWLGEPYESSCVAVADLDGDDTPDLVFANPVKGMLRVRLGTGATPVGFASATATPVDGNPQALAIGDLDGDGRLDVATASYGGSVSVLLADEHGTLGAAPAFPFPGGSVRTFVLADLDVDGHLDAVGVRALGPTSSPSSQLATLLGSGTGSFASTATFAFAPSGIALDVGRVDGDAYPDVVVTGGSFGTAIVAFGSGLGGFSSTVSVPLLAVVWRCRLGDLDNDGDLDLIAASLLGGLATSLGDGLGGFAPAATFATNACQYLGVGDFDGDGKLDALTANSAAPAIPAALVVRLGNGAGGLGAPISSPLVGEPDTLVVGDWNGDGVLDVAAQFLAAHELRVYTGNGQGQFVATWQGPAHWTARSITAGDVNADGALDLVSANDVAHSVSVHFGDGHGHFADPQEFCGVPDPSAVAIADLDGDGRVDLAALDPIHGLLGVVRHGRFDTAVSYCTAGTTTHGCAAVISAIGAASASATSGLEVRATGLEGQRQTFVFYGVSGRIALPWAAGSTSLLCVAQPTQRMLAANSGGTANACDGAVAVDFNAYRAATPGALGQPFLAGQLVHVQVCFRDPGAPKSSNLSNAIQLMLGP